MKQFGVCVGVCVGVELCSPVFGAAVISIARRGRYRPFAGSWEKQLVI